MARVRRRRPPRGLVVTWLPGRVPGKSYHHVRRATAAIVVAVLCAVAAWWLARRRRTAGS